MAHPSSYSKLSPSDQPFFFLTSALVAGILLDHSLSPPFWLTALALMLLIGAAIACYRAVKSTRAALIILTGFIAAGSCLSAAVRHGAPSDGLKRLMEDGVFAASDPVRLFGVLERPPEPVPDGVLLDIRARQLLVAQRVLNASGSARLMLALGDESVRSEYDELKLDYGTEVGILVRLETARSYSNPGSPDFNDFLDRRGYQLKGTIKSPLLIQVLRRSPGNPVLGALYRARVSLMARIDQHFPARVAGTLKAMLAGNRYFVDPDTAKRLRQSAAFHILVIAGLHIGIIAWVIVGGHLSRRRDQLRILGALIALWAYAVAVGMAPPVLRATIMITVGIIGPMIFRRSASLNTVGLAGLIMLSFEPTLVFDAGFQMSFAAVVGIVGLALPVADKLHQLGNWRPSARTPHPPSPMVVRTLAEILFWDERSFQDDVYRSDIKYRLDKSATAIFLGRWRFQPLLRYIVLLVITSLAIQLATLPLMILYFNRVAPVGIIINIVAGLLAGVIMVGAFLTVCTAPMSAWVSSAFSQVVVGAHYLLVNAVVPFLSVPGASFRSPHYEGSGRLLYVIYYIPIMMLVVLLDRWRPVEVFLPISWLIGSRSTESGLIGAGLTGTCAPSSATVRAAMVAAGPVRSAGSGRTGAIWRRAWRSINYRTLQTLEPPRLAGYTCAALLAISIVAINRPFSGIGRGKLTAYFLDVGQGDSALLVFPRGSTMLVDAGGEIHIGRSRKSRSDDYPIEFQGDEDGIEQGFGDEPGVGEVVVSRFLWSVGLRRLDYALATHAHEDHVGGFEDVLQNFGVGELFVGHSPYSSHEYRRLDQRARAEHVRIGSMSRGDNFTLDDVEVHALWPPPGGRDSLSGNNDSIVLHLRYGRISLLLAGDIEQQAEASLCSSDSDLKADLLKVPHHGSKTSSTSQFLDKVNPAYAVISVGVRSRFGHPHPDVVSRYVDRGVELFETGRDGMVTAETDGNQLNVSSFLSRRANH